MLYNYFLIPQQSDTVKKHSFNIGEDTTPSKSNEPISKEKADTGAVQEIKKENKKKEKESKSKSDIHEEKTEKTERSESKKTDQISQTNTDKEGNSLQPLTEITNNKSGGGKDVIVQHIKNPGTTSSGSPIFTNKELKTNLRQDKFHIQDHQYWIPAIVLFALLIIVWARVSHYKRLLRIGKAFLNIREFYQVVREENAITNSLSIGMAALFIFTSSLFIYQVNAYYEIFDPGTNAFLFFVKLAIFVFLFFLLKLLLVGILGSVFFRKSGQINEFIYNIFLMNNINGIALIPITIFMAWFNYIPKPTIILISIVVLVFIFLYRTLRAFNLSVSDGRISRLYFFTYLCTFELLPFIVIFKVILNKF